MTDYYPECMQVGYLSHVAGDRRPREVFRETIELAVTAEAHGFDTFWLAQHHSGHLRASSPHRWCCSPRSPPAPPHCAWAPP